MERTSPLVSVAMPVYNAEKFLRQAIESVLNQTYENFELILVNDGSQDNSKQIIFSFSDPRIRYFENEANLGITRTRNKCVEYSQGKYIAVLDNDDIALPNRLEKQVEFMESDDRYGICGSFYEQIDAEGHLIGRRTMPVDYLAVKTYLLFENCFCNSSVLIQSRLLKERNYAEGFNMIEDYYFLYNSSKTVRLSNLALYTTQYRIHGKNTSIEKAAGMSELRRKIDELILKDLGIHYSPEEFELHTHFVTGNFQYFKTEKQISELELWILKLYTCIQYTNAYDMDTVEKVLIGRWMMLFIRNRKYSPRFIFNRISKKFKIKYIRYFLNLYWEKFSMTKSSL